MSNERLPPDQKAREIIRKDLDHNVWVEAGAGSGKTTELVRRIVALVAAGAPVGEIAAITFTRKAAAELKTRCQIELEKAFQDTTVKTERERFGAALRDVDALCADTIHSFCAQILRERPLEAGISPAFALISKPEDLLLQKTKLQERLDDVRQTEPKTWDELQSSGIRAPQLQDAFRKLCMFAEVDFPAKAGKRPATTGILEQLKALQKELSQRVADEATGQKEGKELHAAYRRLDGLLRVRAFDDLADFLAALNIFKEPFEDFKGAGKEKSAKGWKTKDTGYDAQRLCNQFGANTAVPFLAAWDLYLYSLVLNTLLPARQAVLAARVKAGTLNENDLLRLTAQLLREHPDARRYFQKRIRRLLVDEFQDTDPIQAELMLLLTGDSETSDWTKQKPRPGSLFIVGDPKQSIFRFRRADIAVYKQVKEMLVKSGAKLAPLQATFRNQPAICDWANAVFKGILPPQDDGLQAAFAPLMPMRQAPKGYEPGLRKLLIPAAVAQKDIPLFEAEAMAAFIRHAVDTGWKIDAGRWDKPGLRGAKFSDFLIISRGKGDLTTYAAAMDRLGIPCDVIGLDAGGAWEALRTLIGLLRCLADPEDEVSVVAALRGPMFGLSDDELYQHRAKDLGFRFLGLPETATGPVAESLRVMAECYLLSRRLMAGAAVEAILERTGLLASVRAQEGGSAQVSNLFAVIQQIRKESLEGHTLADAVESLVWELEDEKGENLNKTPLAAEEDKVRVMNLHKSKGLEGRVVFLAEPASGKPNGWPVDIHIRREGEKAVGFLPVQEDNGPHAKRNLAVPPDWNALSQLEKRYQDAETNRLLYVAATRAKDFLIISQYAGTIRGAGKPWEPFYPHLKDVPELGIPAVKAAPKGAKTHATLADLKANAKSRQAAVEAATKPSYSLVTVTGTTHDATTRPAVAAAATGEPGGMEFGTLIHSLLEALVQRQADPTDHELAASVKAAIGRDSAFVGHEKDALGLLKNALASSVWAAMRASPKRFSEVPFQALGDAKSQTVVSGAIDLIYRVDGGWAIVDYKTDRIGKDAAPWVELYAPQLKLYREHWERITGEKVVQCGLLFVRTGHVEWIEAKVGA
jgi:ATP-dependent helicase/nuclease subunit A